ncbi:hypothetical protein ACFLWE_00375 [Chloroflexota bacterium]
MEKRGKRIKKPSIKPEQRLDWLRRYDGGESVPHIAEKDFCDVRTVRIHIEKAKQERELKEARATVLRNALERHYEDLCNLAEKLDPKSTGNIAYTSLPADDEILISALHQHLPRSPIWNYLVSSRKLQEEREKLEEALKTKIEETVRLEKGLALLVSAGLSEIVPGFINALNHQVEQWYHGAKGLNVEDNLRAEPAGEGLVQLCYGFSRMDIVKKEDSKKHLHSLRKIVESLEQDVASWDEYSNLRKKIEEIGRLDRKLHEELFVIRLRRIVPGRCRYCPL